jgi:hypothetical protein
MQSHVVFLLFWLLNSISIHLLGLLFPNTIVLGTYRLAPIEASINAGFWLTFFVWTMKDYMSVRSVKFDPPALKFCTFFLLNCFGVWLVSRCSQYTGLGIAKFGWAFLIGGVAQVFQAGVWKIVKDKS